MRPQEIIGKKRDGETLTLQEIRSFVRGVCDANWADYQISAFLMACFVKGLNIEEQTHLTQEMLNSGDVLDFSELNAPKADKHSTGGVGDKTSLIIAPLAAACGVYVPMISGRGLGHTGGTLDKLESISGYNVNLSLAEFRRTIEKCGFSMIGQTAEIAPADKKIYALRDATATVPSIPLIVASIMSKKLAEGLDALVLDVKTGSGAFMQKYEDSVKLAEALVETGKSCGVATEAIISDMSQPLGKYVGNALEVYECLKILRGEANAQMSATLELSIELTAQMLLAAKIFERLENAKSKIQNVLDSGEALERFRRNVEIQGGNAKVCDNPEILLGNDLVKHEIISAKDGYISEVDARAVGESIVSIGGGRAKVEDKVDFVVGYECEKQIGDKVSRGETLGILYCRNQNQAETVKEKLQNAYKMTAEKALPATLIKTVIG